MTRRLLEPTIAYAQSKGLAIAALMSFIVGFAGLSRLLDQQRFSTYRAVDIAQLTHSGACFGAALFAIVLAFRI